jgi:predicted hydrocarbon binding protein
MDIHPHALLALGRPALTNLGQTLFAEQPDHAARYLQEMGYAAGEALHSAFEAWLRSETGVAHAADLPAESLGPSLSRFLVETGWGPVEIEQLSEAVLAVDAADAPEADSAAGYESPSCFMMGGLLADFLGRVSGTTVAVMEVECRSQHAERCRFLVGAPGTLDQIYEHLVQGGAYLELTG